MYRIRTYNNIALKGLERFARDRYEVASDISEPDAVLLRSHKLHDEPLPATVRAIARAGAGVNNIPVPQFTEQGVVVFNTPGANANAVKELVIAGLLLGSRGIVPGMAYAQSLTEISDYGEMNKILEKEKKRFAGNELYGKTLGVVGLGAIGSLVANAGIELGMDVVGYDPAISVEAAWRLSSQVERMENLQSLLGRADYISLHLPALEVTRGMIDDSALAAVKPGAVLLNFARDEIVDRPAILRALTDGKLGKYVCDFPAPELLGREDVLALPHIGASTREAEENCAVMAANQLIDFLENGNIKNSVNFPAIAMERAGDHRITFSNSNVPKVLGNVLGLLADREINVIDMVNKSRDEVAYNIIDIDRAPDDALLAAIREVSGVISVRAL